MSHGILIRDIAAITQPVLMFQALLNVRWSAAS